MFLVFYWKESGLMKKVRRLNIPTIKPQLLSTCYSDVSQKVHSTHNSYFAFGVIRNFPDWSHSDSTTVSTELVF